MPDYGPFDGWKEPKWDDTPITVPRHLLQAALRAVDNVRGMAQRLRSHEEGNCCPLDARDRRALAWGDAVAVELTKALNGGE